MKRDVRVAMVMLLSQLLKVDINKQLELENDFLREENQTFKAQFDKTGKRLSFTVEQRKILAIKGKTLGKRMREVVTIVRPETLLKSQVLPSYTQKVYLRKNWHHSGFRRMVDPCRMEGFQLPFATVCYLVIRA